MMKKTLNKAEIAVFHFAQGDILSSPTNIHETEGSDEELAPTRQQTDFFGNTVLVPTDAEDWE